MADADMNKAVSLANLATFLAQLQKTFVGQDLDVKLTLTHGEASGSASYDAVSNTMSIALAIPEAAEQVEFASKADFPSAGEADRIYVASDEKTMYLWDASSLEYVRVSGGLSPGDVTLIDGGQAGSW